MNDAIVPSRPKGDKNKNGKRKATKPSARASKAITNTTVPSSSIVALAPSTHVAIPVPSTTVLDLLCDNDTIWTQILIFKSTTDADTLVQFGSVCTLTHLFPNDDIPIKVTWRTFHDNPHVYFTNSALDVRYITMLLRKTLPEVLDGSYRVLSRAKTFAH